MNRFEMPPSIEADRIRLVPFSARHFGDFAREWTDPHVMAYVGGVADEVASWERFTSALGQWQVRGCGMYAVETKTGHLLGQCGIWWPVDWPEKELGYTFFRSSWGHGYATEAAMAVRGAAIDAGLTHLVSFIHPDNAPSLRVAARLGAVAAETHQIRGGPQVRHIHNMRGS